MSDTGWTAVVVILWASIGALVWATIPDRWHSRIPRKYFGGTTPTESRVVQGLNKAEEVIRQHYEDLDAVRAQQVTAKSLESEEELSRSFIHNKRALDRALKARDRARGWACLHGFGLAVEKHIKNAAAIATETDAPLEKPRTGISKN